MNRSYCTGLLVACLLAVSTAGAQDAAAAGATDERPVALEATAGFSMLSRKLVYHQDVDQSLAGYTLPAGPLASFDLRWYPGAHFTAGPASAFGVEVRYDRSFGIESSDRGADFTNVARLLELSVLGRLTRPRYELVGMLGSGAHAFVFDPQTPTTHLVPGYSRVPGVDYAYVRFGAEARFVPGGRFGLLASVSYLAVFDLGGIGSSAFFPRATGGGTELRAHALYLLPRGFELRAGLGYRRYFLDMHSRLGDTHVAGGAVDHHVTLDLAASYRY